MNLQTLLNAIPSTEEASFRELLRSDKPDDTQEWSAFFKTLRQAEREWLVHIEWSPNGNGRGGSSVDSVILTEAGAARVRESKR